jgi:beta-xylosidase
MIVSGIADPTIIFCNVNKEYVIAGTSGNFNGFVSKDLQKWQPIGPILQGAAGMDWAPDIVAYKDTYYLTFTRNTRIFMAKSTSGKARGPYIQIAGPLLDKWAIDSHVFIHNNTPYIFWNEGDGIKVGILNSAMTSISNAKHAFGVKTHGEGWITQTVQEAPCVLPYKDRFLIFFSGNSTGPKYGIGVCVADHPYNGPFVKLKNNPLIQKNGSGHCSITKDSKGYVIAFHMGGNRSTHLGRITFDDDDTPRITSF